MKKIAALIMVLALSLSLLSGCFRIPKNVQNAIESAQAEVSQDANSGGDDSSEATDSSESTDSGTAPSDLAPATNPSEGYNNYITVKSAATDRITAVADKSDALAMTVTMGLLGVSMVDLSLLTLTAFSSDLASSEMAMGFLGLKDVKISGNGNEYTITYTDSDGASIKQTCEYDPGKDTLKSVLYDAQGDVSMYFEYVNEKGTYTAQYYYPGDEGGFEVIRSHFDGDNIAAFGTITMDGAPDSIFGKGGFSEEFVKNDNSYMILKDDKLTVFDNGTTTTN